MKSIITIILLILFIDSTNTINAINRVVMMSSGISSKEAKIRNIIEKDWDCDLSKCKNNDYDCQSQIQTKYEFNNLDNCKNKIVGQYSELCLNIGKNNLKKKIFLGKFFSLELEENVVAECIKYDIYTHFVSECYLYIIDINNINNVDISINQTVNDNKNKYYHFYYYKITKDKLEYYQEQHELMILQMKYYNINHEYNIYDLRKINYDINLSKKLYNNYPVRVYNNYPIKVSSKNGFSFTLPLGITHKCSFPIIPELNMEIQLYDGCYHIEENISYVNIKKSWLCYFKSKLFF